MGGRALRERPSARLVVLNARNEIFLLYHHEQPMDQRLGPDPSVQRRYWVTPSGGVEPGETWEQAALRELWEETGIDGVPLGPCVWVRRKAGAVPGERTMSIERYYLVRVEDPSISTDYQLEHERAVYQSFRWWPGHALLASSEAMFPVGIGELLDPILRGHLPVTPVDISARG
jgi:8-oxo-dGTP pyrophosphatase MutT (NUDIX family)